MDRLRTSGGVDCAVVVAWSVLSALRAAISQTLTVPSELPEKRFVPSELNAIELTHDLWPVSVARGPPVEASQSLIVVSMLAVASVLPSGLAATLITGPRWPCKVTRTFASCRSQMRAV